VVNLLEALYVVTGLTALLAIVAWLRTRRWAARLLTVVTVASGVAAALLYVYLA
jgi:hypothetical protein